MTVHFRAKALDDIASIHLYRSREHSVEVAERVEAAIFATTKMLGRHPEFGAATDHHGVRRWPMTEYEDEALDVLRVVDGRYVRDLRKVP